MSDQPKTTAADQPPSGKDHRKPCLCNGICLGKEHLHSNRVCQFDLACPAQSADATNWKQRAETAEAELARHPVSVAEANELHDILRTLTNSGTALKTSARELVSAWTRQAHEIDDLRHKLTAANERLAKVRDALTRLRKWTEFSLISESIIAEAEIALSEGER